MEIRGLNENWNMHTLREENWQTAVVPGSVYTDLLRNQNMENPYWKDNEDKICARMEADYEYCCVFEEMDTDSYSHMVLRFEGLDTAAEVYLNDTLLGIPCNMHRTWEYEVKALLKERNILRVIFCSPLKYIA